MSLELLNLRGHRLESVARTAPVAVLSISRLLRTLDWLRPGLGAQEGDKKEGGFWGFTQGCRKAPGCAGGLAVVVEVEMALRDAGKAREGVDGIDVQ